MALVSIKVTVGSSVLLENSYEASSELTPKNVVEPGPGVYGYTGRHDGAAMSSTREDGPYAKLAESLRKCRQDAERVLTEAMEASAVLGDKRKHGSDQ